MHFLSSVIFLGLSANLVAASPVFGIQSNGTNGCVIEASNLIKGCADSSGSGTSEVFAVLDEISSGEYDIDCAKNIINNTPSICENGQHIEISVPGDKGWYITEMDMDQFLDAMSMTYCYVDDLYVGSDCIPTSTGVARASATPTAGAGGDDNNV